MCRILTFYYLRPFTNGRTTNDKEQGKYDNFVRLLTTNSLSSLGNEISFLFKK